MTRLPPGWSEQRPIGGEVARWCCKVANGASLTVALRERDGRRGVELWSGPGTCKPATASPEDLWALANGLGELGDWLNATGLPEPAEQPSLFDEAAVT